MPNRPCWLGAIRPDRSNRSPRLKGKQIGSPRYLLLGGDLPSLQLEANVALKLGPQHQQQVFVGLLLEFLLGSFWSFCWAPFGAVVGLLLELRSGWSAVRGLRPSHVAADARDHLVRQVLVDGLLQLLEPDVGCGKPKGRGSTGQNVVLCRILCPPLIWPYYPKCRL